MSCFFLGLHNKGRNVQNLIQILFQKPFTTKESLKKLVDDVILDQFSTHSPTVRWWRRRQSSWLGGGVAGVGGGGAWRPASEQAGIEPSTYTPYLIQ